MTKLVNGVAVAARRTYRSLAKVHSFSELTKENYFVSFVFTHNKKKTRELFPNIGNYSVSLLKFRR